MIILQQNIKYELWTGDIIKVNKIYKDILKNKSLVLHAECTTIEKAPYSYYHHIVKQKFKGLDYPGFKLGDKTIYLVDGGLYCGWDHRAFQLHVKKIKNS